MTTNASLLIDSHHGTYIPQFFAEGFQNYITNKEELAEYLPDLTTPDNEHYWDSWEHILDNAKLTDDNGRECILIQIEGDLWAIPENEIDEIPEL